MKNLGVLVTLLSLLVVPLGSTKAQGHVYTKAAPSGPIWTTTSSAWIDIPDLNLWFYQYDEGNACIGISAESYGSTGSRVAVRVLVDGSPASPADVIFTSETEPVARLFQFSATIGRGAHHVVFQTVADPGGTASFGDRTMWVITAPNLVNVVAPPSGANLVTTSAQFTEIAGMSLNIVAPVQSALALTFCAEVVCDEGKNVFVRALVDGEPAEPSDVVITHVSQMGVHSMTFVRPWVAAGPHTVSMVWHISGGGTATMGDRSLSIAVIDAAAMEAGTGGVASVSPRSGPDTATTSGTWQDIPGLALDVLAPENAILVATLQGEAELSGGRMFVRATVDGESCSPSDAVFTYGSGFPGTSGMAFMKKNVPGGFHRVTAQWHVDPGNTGYFGDRNLTVTILPADGPNLTSEFPGLEPAIRSNPVLVLLWDPQRPTDPAPSVGAMSNLVHGDYPSVEDYFRTLSDENFSVTNAGILGWFPSDEPSSFYWAPQDPTDADGDGFISGHVRKWWEAVTKADQTFDYASFDDNGDGVLDPEELGIVIVIPQNGPFGTNRVPAAQEYPTWQPLVVDGVRIPLIAEVYAGSPPNLGVFVHELSHLLLNLPDMYFNFFFPFAAGHYSIMDVTYIDSHFDPFHKIRLGWLQPTIVRESGFYSLYPCESGGGAYLLMDPQHGNQEYYLVENRQRGLAYDSQMADSGMAVWHVMEDPDVYGNLSAPEGVSPTDWTSVAAGDWGRRAIRMIRPVYGPPFDNSKALWDGADPATGYDLLSNDPAPGHAQLRWVDGSPSGFAIRDISSASGTMQVWIDVPGTATYVAQEPPIPGAFGLMQNYPNPFNPATVIEFALPRASLVTLQVYNLLGEELVTLASEYSSAGKHKVQWDATGRPSGVYFYRLTAGEYIETRKMVLIK